MACLLVANSGLYVSQRLTDLVYAGDPLNAIRILSEFAVDEIVVLEVSKYHHMPKSKSQLLAKLAENCASPLTIGGSINSIEQVMRFHDLGFDKTLVRSALSDKAFLEKVASKYGSQSLVACLDIVKINDTLLKVNKKHMDFRELIDEINSMQNLGIGEIVIHDISNQGLQCGFSLFSIVEEIARLTSIPLNLMGGFLGFDESKDVMEEKHFRGKISIILSTSIFVRKETQSIFIQYSKAKG